MKLRFIKKLKLTYLIIFFFTPTFSMAEETIFQTLNIKDWGFSSIAEIQHIATVVFKDKNGKHLVVYDMRNKPPPPSPKAPLKDLFSFSKNSTPYPLGHLKKALWLWDTEKLIETREEVKSFLAFCKKEKFTHLYLQIPYKSKTENNDLKTLWNSNKIKSLIAQIHKQKMEVYALDGDPQFTLSTAHPKVINFVESILEYNSEVVETERFDGIHFDIEPHFLSDFYSKKKESILVQYLDLLRKIKRNTQRANLKLGIDFPPSFDRLNDVSQPMASIDGRPMSQWILEIVDEITLMDYKTSLEGPHGIIEEAKPILEYASRKGKKVWIGLETEVQSEELEQTFEAFGSKGPAPENSTSQLLLKPIKGFQTQLIWKDFSEASQTPKGAKLFYSTSRIVVSPDSISFAGKNKKQLKNAMEQSAAAFAPYSAFQGFAIHSYESYRFWVQKN